ncbi:MAG: hypothetical protein ACFFFC_20755, partial [Candidatus Thorarchaeota archaeon]
MSAHPLKTAVAVSPAFVAALDDDTTSENGEPKSASTVPVAFDEIVTSEGLVVWQVPHSAV